MPSIGISVGTPVTGQVASVTAAKQTGAEKQADVAIGISEAAARDSVAEAAVRNVPTPLEQLLSEDALARFR